MACTRRCSIGAGITLIALASLVDAPSTAALRNIKVGDQIPAFSLKTLDGKSVDKAAYHERILLLILARPEHKKSLAAMMAGQRLARENPDTKLSVLAVSTKPGAADYFKKIAGEHGISYPIALDPDRKLYGDFGLIVSPTTLLIDGDGTLRFELAHLPPNYEQRLRAHAGLMLGKISLEIHDTTLEQLQKNKASGFSTTERRLNLAETLVKKRKFDQALAVLGDLKAPDYEARIAALAGLCLLELGKLDEAGARLDPHAERDPASATLKLALGRLEIRRDRDKQAEQHFLGGLEVSPGDGLLLYELGGLYERRGDLAKAVGCYRRALEAALDLPHRGSHRRESGTTASPKRESGISGNRHETGH